MKMIMFAKTEDDLIEFKLRFSMTIGPYVIFSAFLEWLITDCDIRQMAKWEDITDILNYSNEKNLHKILDWKKTILNYLSIQERIMLNTNLNLDENVFIAR